MRTPDSRRSSRRPARRKHLGAAVSSVAFGLYTSGSTVYLRVEKVCSIATRESVEYTLTYHL